MFTLVKYTARILLAAMALASSVGHAAPRTNPPPLPPTPQLEGPLLGDLNHRPIHFYFSSTREGEFDRAVLLGHADGPCCAEVSRAITAAANGTGLSDAWIGYGAGQFVADPRARSATLTTLHRELDDLSNKSVCRGQIQIHQVPVGASELEGAQLRGQLELSARAATRQDRPVMVRVDRQKEFPLLVAMYALGPGGAATPLRIEVPAKLFAGLRPLAGAVSAGVGQYIAALRARRDGLKALLAMQSKSTQERALIEAYAVGERGVRLNYRDRDLEHDLLDDLAQARAMRALLVSVETILDVLEEEVGLVALQSELRNEIATHVAHVEESLRTTSEALRSLRRLSSRGGREIELRWTRLAPSQHLSAADRSAFAQLFTTFSADELRARIDATNTALAGAKKIRDQLPPDPLALLVDASMRGWPATFSSDKMEGRFDRWVAANQGKVWDEVGRVLAEQGVRINARVDETNPLLSSTLAFRIKQTPGKLVLEPVQVVTGPFYMVADPKAGLAWVESTASDHVR